MRERDTISYKAVIEINKLPENEMFYKSKIIDIVGCSQKSLNLAFISMVDSRDLKCFKDSKPYMYCRLNKIKPCDRYGRRRSRLNGIENIKIKVRSSEIDVFLSQAVPA